MHASQRNVGRVLRRSNELDATTVAHRGRHGLEETHVSAVGDRQHGISHAWLRMLTRQRADRAAVGAAPREIRQRHLVLGHGVGMLELEDERRVGRRGDDEGGGARAHGHEAHRVGGVRHVAGLQHGDGEDLPAAAVEQLDARDAVVQQQARERRAVHHADEIDREHVRVVGRALAGRGARGHVAHEANVHDRRALVQLGQHLDLGRLRHVPHDDVAVLVAGGDPQAIGRHVDRRHGAVLDVFVVAEDRAQMLLVVEHEHQAVRRANHDRLRYGVHGR